MKALILAAGMGERLRPLTDVTPKPMLELGGRPLIHYPLAMLRRGGVTEVAINVHHLASAVRRGLGDGSELGLRITYAPEPVLLGTGGPLNGLRQFLGGIENENTFVIVNSDTILDLDLRAMLAFHRERAALATIALFRPANLDYYSRLEIDAGQKLRRMRLLARRDPLQYDDYPAGIDDNVARSLSPFMYCGVIVADHAVFDLMPTAPPWSIMAGLFAPMVARGLPVFGYVHRGYFRTIDDLKTYNALKAEFASSPPPEILTS
ncbi:nucleotidyltransferase family protein [Mycobacterium sp.]|jgi:mannose-1-phosphate guanylyltransferase|uniref:nucleotidyltransferase family protein n=1 Tax=Mycobacterium sp. TaxID=1785 RepID=UPI003F998CA9